MESLILLGIIAVSAFLGFVGLRLAKTEPLYGLITICCSALGLLGVSFALLPEFTRLKAAEHQHKIDIIDHQVLKGKFQQCDKNQAATEAASKRLASVHKHLSQAAFGLKLRPIELTDRSTPEEVGAILSSLEATAAIDEFSGIGEVFAKLPNEVQQLGLALDAAQFASADRSRKLALIGEALRSIRVPACPEPQPPALKLKEKLGSGVSAALYKIERLPMGTFVADLPGDWYQIVLKSTRSENLLSFLTAPNYYTLPDDTEDAIRRAVARLWSEIIANLPPSRRLFVRGRSDQRRWTGPLLPGDENASVRIHKGSESIGYARHPEKRTLSTNNSNLPNWRGRYLQTIIPDVSILAGEENTTATGELLLFVDWSKPE